MIRYLIENSDQPTKKLEVKQTVEGAQEVPGLVEARGFGTNEVWELLKSGSEPDLLDLLMLMSFVAVLTGDSPFCSSVPYFPARGAVGCGLEMSFDYCLSGDLLLKRRCIKAFLRYPLYCLLLHLCCCSSSRQSISGAVYVGFAI